MLILLESPGDADRDVTLTFDGGSRRAGLNHHSIAIGKIIRVVLLTQDIDEGAALLFLGRRWLHGSRPERRTKHKTPKKSLDKAGYNCTAYSQPVGGAKDRSNSPWVVTFVHIK